MAFELATQEVVTSLAQQSKLAAKVFVETVRDQCLSTRGGRQATDNELIAFLMVASRYKLDPILKQIHGFEDKSGKIRAVLGVDGFIKMAHDTKRLKGIQFDERLDEHGVPTAVTCTLHVEGFTIPLAVTEYLVECQRETPTWKQMPSRMLRHRAFCQAVRLAFGFGGVELDDEFEASQVELVKPKYEFPQAKPVSEAGQARPPSSLPPPAPISSSPQPAADGPQAVSPLAEGEAPAAVADDVAKLKKDLRDKLVRLVRGKGHDWQKVAAPYLQQTFGAATSASMSVDQLTIAVEWAEALPKAQP